MLENPLEIAPQKSTEKAFEDNTIRVANQLVRSRLVSQKEQYDLFMITLAHLNAFEKNSNVVLIDKKRLFQKLGLTNDNRYSRVKKAFKAMTKNTWVEFSDPNEPRNFKMGFLITGVESDYRSKFFEVKLNPDFMPLMQELKSFYTTFELDSILKFSSAHSQRLYTYLCSLNSDFSDTFLTTKQLKDLFGLSKDEYVRKSNGTFNRFIFEKYVLNVAVEEVSEKTKFSVSYEKEYQGKAVRAYHLTWTTRREVPGQLALGEQAENYPGWEPIDWKKAFKELNGSLTFLCKEEAEFAMNLRTIQSVWNYVMHSPDDRKFRIEDEEVSAKQVQETFRKLSLESLLWLADVVQKASEELSVKHMRNWLISVMYTLQPFQEIVISTYWRQMVRMDFDEIASIRARLLQ